MTDHACAGTVDPPKFGAWRLSGAGGESGRSGACARVALVARALSRR
jgi:hypothetical protein